MMKPFPLDYPRLTEFATVFRLSSGGVNTLHLSAVHEHDFTRLPCYQQFIKKLSCKGNIIALERPFEFVLSTCNNISPLSIATACSVLSILRGVRVIVQVTHL